MGSRRCWPRQKKQLGGGVLLDRRGGGGKKEKGYLNIHLHKGRKRAEDFLAVKRSQKDAPQRKRRKKKNILALLKKKGEKSRKFPGPIDQAAVPTGRKRKRRGPLLS